MLFLGLILILADSLVIPKNDPINLSQINSTYGDFSPYISADGKTMYFSSSRTGGLGGEDIWVTYLENGNWLSPKNLGKPVNSELNEGSQCISADGRLLIFTLCNNKGTYGSCDLYFSKKDKNGNWSNPENMGPVVNSTEWDGHPSLSMDGKTLYFASQRRGGYGGIDLWVTSNEDGRWFKPRNLKYPINSARDEISPFIHSDDKTLYFSSSGHGGYGGLDVFKTTKDERGEWSEPLNLGVPINTSGDDYFFSIPASGVNIYISSDRAGGIGDKDIYSFPLNELLRPRMVVTLAGKVLDKYGQNPIKARITVENLSTAERVAQTESNEDDGSYYVVIPWGSLYGVTVESNGYVFHSENFDLRGGEEYREYNMNYELQPVKVGESITLNNLFFDFNKSEIRPESFPELDRAVELMNKYPSMKVEIWGFADSIGTKDYNLKLSEKRALAVRDYIISKGIVENRIGAKGFGFENPVASNETEEGRQRNHRTEFHILEQ